MTTTLKTKDASFVLDRSLTTTPIGRPSTPVPSSRAALKSIDLPGVTRRENKVNVALSRGAFALPAAPIDTHRDDCSTRVSFPVWYTLDAHDEYWLQAQGGALDVQAMETVLTALELAAFSVQQPPERITPDPGTMSAMSVVVSEDVLARLSAYWVQRRGIQQRPLLPELADWPSDGIPGLLSDTPFLSRDAELHLWRRKVDAPSGLDVPPDAALQYMQRAVAALEATVERETLRMQHTEVSLAELAALRPRQDAVATPVEQRLARPLSPLRAASVLHAGRPTGDDAA